MEISELYDIYNEYPVVTTDSRNCPKDSIFFALKGENFNGNRLPERRLRQVVLMPLWTNGKVDPNNERVIVVDDVLETLQKLANHHRRKLKIPIIAITGTNGKTTTKELVAAILSKEFNVAYTQGNFNNHIGVPLTLLSMNENHEIGVVEMGRIIPVR